LAFSFELLARFVVPRLRKQTRRIFKPHHVVVGVDGKSLLELTGSLLEKPVLHHLDCLANVRCCVAARNWLGGRSERLD
jgi:hypothetical protein